MFQETKEIQVTSAPRVGKWHDLAEAIRVGSLLVPQAFCQMAMKHGEVIVATCARGAAKMAGYVGPEIRDDLYGQCPACEVEGSVITHLNDDHRWTRERIADWLDTL